MRNSLILIPLSLAVACGHADIRRQYQDMRPAMVRGDWPTAASQIEAAKETVYGEKDRVMFWLNAGTLHHYAGDQARSMEYLAHAEEAMQELWTTSVSAEASKVLLNETAQSYPGEDFEKVLIYLYTSLNNVKRGKVADAIVEARRADETLKKMLVHYEKEGEIGTLYKQDAFMLWLVGLFYEMEGSSGLSDAHLAYKAALKSYQEDYAGQYGLAAPSFVREDVVRTAKLLGAGADFEGLARETGAAGETAERMQTMGEVVVIHAGGEAPAKEEFFVDGIMPDAYVMRIALPRFVPVPHHVSRVEVKAAGQSAKSEIAEPVSTMVLKNFEHRLPAITTRAVARATIKYLATKAAQAAAGGDSAAGQLVGLVGNVAAAATEAADLRSWTTLPAEIGVARMWVTPGPQAVEVAFLSESGAQLGTQTFNVDVQAGERRILSVRTLE